MKKNKFLLFLIISIFCFTGCGKEEQTIINSNSQLASAKTQMINNLNNYSYDVNITVKTGIMDVTTNMNCKDDRKNQISYCYTSTYGVETEEYVDYKNNINYSKVTTLYGTDETNGKWTSTKYNGSNANSWINLNDYIFNITEESRNGGTYYTGTIDSKKLASAMAQTDSSINIDKVVSEDINISVFVNSSNYIETMNFTMEILGIEEVVEISYKNFNTTGNIEIPAEVK